MEAGSRRPLFSGGHHESTGRLRGRCRQGVPHLEHRLGAGSGAARSVYFPPARVPAAESPAVSHLRPAPPDPHQRRDLRLGDRQLHGLFHLHHPAPDQDQALEPRSRPVPALSLQRRHRPGGGYPHAWHEPFQGVRRAGMAGGAPGGGSLGDLQCEHHHDHRQAPGRADVHLPLVRHGRPGGGGGSVSGEQRRLWRSSTTSFPSRPACRSTATGWE